MTIREGSTFRARVKDGTLEPLEKIGLPEGTKVLIEVREIPSESVEEASPHSAGGWKSRIEDDK